MADFYLSEDNCVRRLYAEYTKHKSLIVGFDFDDTVFDFHRAGHTFDEVIEQLRRAKMLGCYLIIITGNPNTELIRTYCAEQNIPYDAINEHAPFLIDTARKIYCNIMLDDRAGLPSSYAILKRVLDAVEEHG